MKCVVCKKRFSIEMYNVYRVGEGSKTTVGVFIPPDKVYDAIDCPSCGCQHLLKVRLPEVKDGVEDDD